MKKTPLILALFLFIVQQLSAQEPLKNKNGVLVMPEAGELALGFDAAPFLRYAGNLLNGENNAPNADFMQAYPMTITGIYMKRNDFGYRASVRLGFGTEKSDTLVKREGSTNPNETVSNETKTNSSDITIGAGIQKWRGKSRFKGIYGAEFRFNIATEKTTYSYGNPLSAQSSTSTRTISDKSGSTFGFMLRGFVGIEYFFAAKASLGAEFGWGPALQTKGRGEVKSESWTGNGVNDSVTETDKSSSFRFDNDNASGSINLRFYF